MTKPRVRSLPIKLALALGIVASFTVVDSCAEKPSVDILLADPCLLRPSETGAPLRDASSEAGAIGSDCSPATPGSPLAMLCGKAYCTHVARWAELSVFQGGCPSDAQLSVGATSGAVFTAVADASQGLPSVGDLGKEPFGFAALLRDEKCQVVGYGCTNADLSAVRTITIEVDPTPPAGACVAPASCVAGQCQTGGVADAAADGPKGCNFQLVKAGELPAPLEKGANETGAAIVASSTGFVVVYREENVAASKTRVASMPLGDEGVAGTPSYVVTDTCPGVVPTDGVSAVMGATSGVVAISQPACSAGDAGATAAGATFLALKSDGTLGSVNKVLGPADIKLTANHALTVGAATGNTQFAYVSSGAASVFDIDGTLAPAVGTAILPIAAGTTNTFAAIARATGLSASLVDAPAEGGIGALFTVTPEGALADAGVDAAGTDGGPVGPTTTELASGAFGSIAAWSGRAIAVVGSSSGQLSFDARSSAGASIGAGALTGGPFGAVDVANLGDRVLLAAGATHGITMFRLDGATSGKLPASASSTQAFSQTLGGVSLGSYDGKSISVAAARNRVAVAWVTRQSLGSSDATGGFAVFACTP